MKSQKLMPFILTALTTSLMGAPSGAATISSGATGIGYVAKIELLKTDMKDGAPEISVQTGKNFTPSEQNIPYVKPDLAPFTKSDAWCDPAANPKNHDNTSFDECYGNAKTAKWVLLDFNKLKKQGVGKVAVQITAKRYFIGNADLGANDLVPALTVFQGIQNQGTWGDWFPNKFQQDPKFWGWKLTPFTGGTTESSGWATAYNETGGLESVFVDGVFVLKGGNNNYLSVAVGGDARVPGDSHDANFELVVSVKKYTPKPGALPLNCGAPPPMDACWCSPGFHWHPQMGHCMEDSRFTGEYAGQAIQGEQCYACGCKRTLAYGKCP